MKDIKPSIKVLCTVLVMCMVFSAGISTLAENNTTIAPSLKTQDKIKTDNHKQYLEDAVVKLVQEGKLSKEKADKILEYRKKKADEFSRLTKGQKSDLKNQRNKGSLLKELIQEGIITEAEAQIIRVKLHEMKDARLSDGLQSLVEKGVLTSKDIENIKSYMVKDRERRKADIEKLKTMTPEEKEKYFKESKKERKNILKRMVEDKVITEEQAKEIKNAIPELSRFK